MTTGAADELRVLLDMNFQSVQFFAHVGFLSQQDNLLGHTIGVNLGSQFIDTLLEPALLQSR